MKNVAAVIVTLLSVLAIAGEFKEKPRPPLDLMHKFLQSVTALRPYMFSAEKFNDPKNEKVIAKELKNMTEVSQKAVHNPALETPVFRPSVEVIRDHIKETEKVFKSGGKDYARWMLNSTLTMCMSCHTQLSTDSRQLLPVSVVESYTSEFDQAEFLFTVRNFDKAHELYKKTILKYPGNKLPILNLETALEREVAYYARIKRDAQAGAKALKEYQKLTTMPTHLKNNLKEWIAQFQSWAPDEIFELKNPTADQIKIFIKKHLESDKANTVDYLYGSGVLYEYLSKNPKTDLSPEVLYWLAICDRRVNNNFFYSLADIYLKDCITQYPKTAAAKKCYQEYEDETTLSYTGSSGTHMPEEVKAELNRLKAMTN